MTCITFQPDGVDCADCHERLGVHPLLPDGRPNVDWEAPPFDQWAPAGSSLHRAWWCGFVVMDGQPVDHVAGCDCEPEDDGNDPNCSPAGPWVPALWFDAGAHGFVFIRWLTPNESATLPTREPLPEVGTVEFEQRLDERSARWERRAVAAAGLAPTIRAAAERLPPWVELVAWTDEWDLDREPNNHEPLTAIVVLDSDLPVLALTSDTAELIQHTMATGTGRAWTLDAFPIADRAATEELLCWPLHLIDELAHTITARHDRTELTR